MAAKNDITGDFIKSKVISKNGLDQWDTIFGKKEPKAPYVYIPPELPLSTVSEKEEK